jgi:hypothetical protein
MTGPRDLTDLDLDATISDVLQGQAATVAAWRRNEPGSWGALAGQAVLAVRRALGRSLTNAERRQVWHSTWDQLTRIRR